MWAKVLKKKNTGNFEEFSGKESGACFFSLFLFLSFFLFSCGKSESCTSPRSSNTFCSPEKEKKRKKSLLTCSISPWRKIYLENPEWLRLRSAGRGDRSNFSKLPSFSLPGKLGGEKKPVAAIFLFFLRGTCAQWRQFVSLFFISCCLSKSVCLCLMEFCPLWPKTDNSQIDNYFFI